MRFARRRGGSCVDGYGRQEERSCRDRRGQLSSFGSRDYALEAMHALYDVAADAVSIAEAAVRAAIEFDDGTGAPVESHVIRLPVLEVEELELLLKL
jgi:hypothetical protein